MARSLRMCWSGQAMVVEWYSPLNVRHSLQVGGCRRTVGSIAANALKARSRRCAFKSKAAAGTAGCAGGAVCVATVI